MELIALVALGCFVGGVVLGAVGMSHIHGVANTAAAAAINAATSAKTAVTARLAPIQIPSVATIDSDVSSGIAELKTKLDALIAKPPIVLAAAPLAPAAPSALLAPAALAAH